LGYIHPATFPEKLAEDHILSWSNPGDLVLDPMCGAGTTLKMAKKNQRNYIGIDMSEEYCSLSQQRLNLV
jgi:site-specific DNA-methyltransferase (adenine-specific)